MADDDNANFFLQSEINSQNGDNKDPRLEKMVFLEIFKSSLKIDTAFDNRIVRSPRDLDHLSRGLPVQKTRWRSIRIRPDSNHLRRRLS